MNKFVDIFLCFWLVEIIGRWNDHCLEVVDVIELTEKKRKEEEEKKKKAPTTIDQEWGEGKKERDDWKASVWVQWYTRVDTMRAAA